MLQLIGNSLWGLVLAALGMVFIFGARTLVEIGRGHVYPPTHYKPQSARERPIGWWTLLPLRWFGFTLICAGLAVVVWTFWSAEAADDCLDAGGRWLESEQLCEGVR